MQRIKKTNAVNVVFMWKLLDFSLDMPPTIEWREKICEVMSLSKETADILVTCVQRILDSTIVLTKALYGGTPSKRNAMKFLLESIMNWWTKDIFKI